MSERRDSRLAGVDARVHVDLGPLSAKVDDQALAAYRRACEAVGYPHLGLASSTWRDRYRLATFGAANGMDYLPEAPASLLPGREKDEPGHAAFVIYDALTSRQQPQVMLATVDDPYTYIGIRAGAAVTVEMVGISLGRVNPSFFARSRPTDKSQPDPLLAHFRGDATLPRIREMVPPSLITALLELAPGWDFGLAGEWFYIQRMPTGWFKAADPKRIADNLALAARLAPYVAHVGDQARIAEERGAAADELPPETPQQRKARERREAQVVERDRRPPSRHGIVARAAAHLDKVIDKATKKSRDRGAE